LAKRIEWTNKHCPVCGRQFAYVEGGYEPSTCNNFDCVHRWLHDPKFKEERKYGKQTRATA